MSPCDRCLKILSTITGNFGPNIRKPCWFQALPPSAITRTSGTPELSRGTMSQIVKLVSRQVIRVVARGLYDVIT
jgi:hypothetical protein